MEHSIAQAEQKTVELQNQLAEHQDRLAEQQQRLAERERQLANYERALRRAEVDRKALQQALDQTNATLARLRGSVSWRATLPIRLVSRAAVRADEFMREKARALRRAFRPRLRDAHLIENSGLFDRDYYLREYPEVARSGMDPILHFLTVGAKEGKNPSPYFDTVYYARQMDSPRPSAAAQVKD